ncbi:centrosomal protein POC5 [Indicator indicator]|uniref:centrosomal protein POC5 n=1 Tax=Indicator indicator TaxID=1002788 RepID=UPI0023DF3875|nr:centrosomal protein POC5 [Indicator indicator]
MSSDEEKSSSPVLPKNSFRGSTVSSDLQDEYEELYDYAVVTPKFEQCVAKWSEPASELKTVKQPSEAHMERPCPVLSEETSSREHMHSPKENEAITTELTFTDENVTQIENILDFWSGSLKTNVLTELRKWKLSLIEQLKQEKEKHAAHVRQLSNETENLKELLRTYEISIGRKDEVIANLTQALEKQKERVDLMRNFTLWQIRRVEAKQQEYANRIADRQFQTALMKKVWVAWRSLSEEKWKEKVAKACQSRAEDVCVQLTNDYEAKIVELTAALDQAKAEVLRMRSEREQYENTMKKAFLRGVCALNMEAMTMFQGKDSSTESDTECRRNYNDPFVAGKLPPSQYNPPSSPLPPATTLQQEDMFSTHLGHASTSQTRLDSYSSVIVSSTAAGSGVASTQKPPMAKVITSSQQKAGRTITARIMGRADMGQKARISGSLAVMGVSPPMSSLIVEKHHPVTQQTISQATAAKYPRTVLHSSGSATVRPAGQAGQVLHGQTHSSVQSIKVVD